MSPFEVVHELGLFLRIEHDVRVNAEDKELVPLTAREELVEILGLALLHQIEHCHASRMRR